MLLRMSVSNCSAQLILSALTRVKTFFSSSKKEERLNYLALLATEAETHTDSEDINIEDFTSQKYLRQPVGRAQD
jgi:hypothetical protein